MSEQPPTNPYAPSQIQTDAEVFQLGPEWERIPNPAYDGAPFPRSIPFRGEFNFSDYKLLSKNLFRGNRAALSLYILNLLIMWTAIGALMWMIVKVAGFNPAEVLDVEMLFVPAGITLFLVAFVIVRQRRFFPKTPLPVNGTIEPSGIISQKRDQKSKALIEATAFYAWADLFYLEPLPDSEEIESSETHSHRDDLGSIAVAPNPLPLRIILYTKDERQGRRGRLLFSKRKPTFVLMHCLEPKMFSGPNDWPMLVAFARLHLAPKKPEELIQAELVE